MTVLVGFAPGKDDDDPLELGALLARSSGEDLHLLTVVPAWWTTPAAGGTDREFAEWSRSRGDEAVAEARALAQEVCGGVGVEASWTPARSVAAGLAHKAGELDARIVVLGSGRGGGYGHVQVTSTADVLLYSSPVAVAIAPRGFTAPDGATVSRVTCAFRGDDASRHTLVRAAEVCGEVGAALRIATFAVRGRTMFPPETGLRNEDDVLAAWAAQAATAQVEALAALPSAAPDDIETVIAQGRTWQAALDRLEWRRDEVIVLGSSRGGLAARLFLGSHGRKILRAAPVPVVVVP